MLLFFKNILVIPLVALLLNTGIEVSPEDEQSTALQLYKHLHPLGSRLAVNWISLRAKVFVTKTREIQYTK